MTSTFTSRSITSTIDPDGTLRLDEIAVALGTPGPDEIVIRIEAAPINPSDLGTLLAFADPASLTKDGASVTGRVPAELLEDLALRVGMAVPVGNEGAGTIVAAGSDHPELVGRICATLGGGMFATHRKMKRDQCLVLPEGTTSVAGAALYVNPLTALSMIDVFHQGGHRGMLHTPASSNLGQMLVRLCAADGIPLVNIVRSARQVAHLRDLGAEYVVDSSAPDFETSLADAIAATGATLAFDAVGGGEMQDAVLRSMETVARGRMTKFNRYGSTEPKRYHLYGGLNTAPTSLSRRYGMDWSISSFFLTSHLAAIGPERTREMQDRVVRDMNGVFASSYAGSLSLRELLDPDNIRKCSAKASGAKYLLVP